MNEEKLNELTDKKNHGILKHKKSYNLLSAIVGRTKKKKKQDDNDCELNCVSSTSTFGSNYADKMASEEFKSINSVGSTESEPSFDSMNKTKNKFFSKFLVKHSSTDIRKQNLYNIGDDAQNANKEKITDRKSHLEFPVTFIKFKKPILSASLIEGVVSLQNLTSRLEQSEKYLLDVLKRYVNDITLQKELIDTLSAHSSLHRETERLTRHLSTEMWSKQLEIEKGQQNTLQDALESVIKQNRQLLVEYEGLYVTYEKLLNKFQNFVEKNDSNEKGCEQEIKEVMKHNIELINKMENVCKQFENQLMDSRKQNESLGDQLSKVSGQLRDLEAVFQRTKSDYDLELKNFKSKEKIMLEIKNSCDIFKKEVESMRNQLNGFPFEFDWEKFKSSEEENLYYIIDIGHLCIKNLTQDVVCLRNKLNIKEKNM
ncbi:uncharacterized protein LOC130903877 [Diorhabda carinulata]|uniref:uncharacterized protein LOC130903877 n=1 Tax=Diorhabda carinulata TaxID=1163345 RepID=UPI0025A30D54|nr:uncharacterized protein LOC130903877 [Diorhabda carinulata]